MAHRGTASSKKADPVAPAFASITGADIIRAPVGQKTIPLDLASLIAPYKRQGRLTLRVERMPQRAKLSAGRNNGDGSWSLASDELEDLNYLVPSNLSGGHELAVRIMSFDNAAAHTLKVIPLTIPAWDNDAEETDKGNIVRSSADAHDPILHNELSKMQSLFAVRDSDIAELRDALKQANAQKEAELETARAAWEAELAQRLAEVTAQAKAETEKEREVWQKKPSQTAQAGILEKVAQELNRQKSEAEERIAAERSQWQAQAEHKIAGERGRWEAEADLRFDAERRQWQARADQQIAEELSRLKTENDRQLETERSHWHAEVQQRIAAEFCRSKDEVDQQLETARQQWQAQAEQKIAEEQARLKAEADQRVEAERQLWQAQANNNGEAERHRLLVEAGERLAAEQKRWQDQVEERFAVERQRWQSESDQRLESERQNWASSSQAAAAEALARWTMEEAARAVASLAEWQQQSSHQLAAENDKCRKLEAALAAALAQSAAAPLSDTDAESERLRQELSALQGVLPERDREIAQLREEMNEQRARWQQEAEAAQAAVQAWKAEEASRSEALVTHARAKMQDDMTAAIARAENAERVLAESQTAPAAEVPRWDDGYVDGLRRDISTLRAALVNREVELGHARVALDQARVQQVVPRPGNAPIRRFAGPEDAPEEASGAKPSFFRDFAILAGVLVPLIVIYPHIAVYLPDGLRSGISTVTGGLLSVQVETPPAPRPSVPLAPAAPRLTATTTRVANVRATAATTGGVLVTLPRDASVIVLQTSGNWTQIELPAKAGTKPQQGWVFSTYLKSPAALKPANASTAVKPASPVSKPEGAGAAAEPASTAAKTENASTAAMPETASTVAKPENASAPAEPQSANASAEPAQ